ncbi:MAG TPA: peptide chain release factor-like protein, partial [Candidatus Paceibacterota bacterium]|nr:peptide chain release factor-like protein [Candidatus Paceibacterota bacterium]
THISFGVIASCQSERTQADNRKKAMIMLLSKLYLLQQEKEHKELLKAKGDKISASWGNQIRSYVLHPYKLIKDLRTGVETSDVESVLNGNLDEFVKEEIKL